MCNSISDQKRYIYIHITYEDRHESVERRRRA